MYISEGTTFPTTYHPSAVLASLNLSRYLVFTLLKVVSAMLGDVTSVGIWSEIPNRVSSPLPSLFRASSKNNHDRSAKPHNTHPLSVIGCYTTDFVGAVGGTICLCVQSRSIYRMRTERPSFLTACLWGGQLEDREERSDGCDHLCFSVESLIPSLMKVFWYIDCVYVYCSI